MSIVDELVCRMCVAFALKFIYLTQITLYNVLQFNSHDISREGTCTHSLTHFGIQETFWKTFHNLSSVHIGRTNVRLLARSLAQSFDLLERARARARTHSRMVKCSLCDSSPCEHWHMWQNAVNTFAVSVLWFLVNTTTLLGWILRTIVVIRSKVLNLPVRQYDNSRR